MLRMGNQVILTAKELKEHFSPWDAMARLKDYIPFARTHCAELDLILSFGGKPEELDLIRGLVPSLSTYPLYAAVTLTKGSWIDLLQAGTTPGGWPIQGANVKAAAESLWNWHCARANAHLADRKTWETRPVTREYLDARIQEKLKHIVQSGGLKETPEDMRQAVLLLALCETAEVDALKVSFRREAQSQDQGQAGQPAVVHLETGDQKMKARRAPYELPWYGKAPLPKGGTIQTGSVTVLPGDAGQTGATICLVDQKTGETVDAAFVPIGETRFFTMTGGRVIRLLPPAAISVDLCVVRKRRMNSLLVKPRKGESWLMNLEGGRENVSCMAAGSAEEQGFLLVSGGSLVTRFYKPCQEFEVRMELEMITEPVMEVRIEKRGYCVLTASGRVLSDIPGRSANGGVATLDPAGGDNRRMVKAGLYRRADAVLSEDGTAIAIRDLMDSVDVRFGVNAVNEMEKEARKK